jgi:hypothetical protein
VVEHRSEEQGVVLAHGFEMAPDRTYAFECESAAISKSRNRLHLLHCGSRTYCQLSATGARTSSSPGASFPPSPQQPRPRLSGTGPDSGEKALLPSRG